MLHGGARVCAKMVELDKYDFKSNWIIARLTTAALRLPTVCGWPRGVRRWWWSVCLFAKGVATSVRGVCWTATYRA